MRRVREAPGCGAACARVLREGGLVCVPTETVYGLICLPDRSAAVARLAALKSRPADKPFALFTAPRGPPAPPGSPG